MIHATNIKQGLSLAAALMAAIAFSGCAKDRTLDDYRREQREQEEARIKAFEGVYQGVLLSGTAATVDGGEPIAPITISVGVQNINSNSPSGPEVNQYAAMLLTVTLAGDRPMRVAFSAGSFDHTSQSFTVSSSVGTRQNIMLQGAFSGDALTGSLYDVEHPDQGGTFTLSRGARAVDASQLRSVRVQKQNSYIYSSYFDPKAHMSSPVDPDQSIRPILLDILHKATSQADQELYDALSPYRTVDVRIRFDVPPPSGATPPGYHRPGAPIVYKDVLWDIAAGTLKGTRDLSNNNSLNLSCTQVYGAQGKQGWQCANDYFHGTFMPYAPGAAGSDQR